MTDHTIRFVAAVMHADLADDPDGHKRDELVRLGQLATVEHDTTRAELLDARRELIASAPTDLARLLKVARAAEACVAAEDAIRRLDFAVDDVLAVGKSIRALRAALADEPEKK